MESNGIVKKLIKNNYIFSIFAKVFQLGIGILISALQVRFWGKELNGRLSYITSTSSILNTVFVFGIHQSYAYYRKQKGKEIAGYFLGSSSLLFGGYLILSILVQLVVRPSFDIAVIVLTFPILYYIRVVRYVTLIEKPTTKNVIEISVSVMKLVLVVVLYRFVQASLFWIVCLLLFEELVSLIFYLCKLKIKPIFDSQSFRFLGKLMAFGFFPMLNLLLNSLNYKVDIVMLKAQSTYEAVSIYSVGVGLADKCWAIPDAIRDILMSKLSNGKTSAEVCKVLRFSNSIVICIQLGLLILGRLIIILLYGKTYVESYNILTIMLLGSYGMIATKMIATFNVVEGHQKANLILMFFTAVANVVANYFWIPVFQIYGAAWASVLSYNLCGIMFILFFIKNYDGIRVKDLLVINKSDITELRKSLTGSKKKEEK